MTEYQPYGARHFLRSLDAEAAGELGVRVVPLRAGGSLLAGRFAELDQFKLGAVLVYRTLVLRTSPVESRPPSVYQLAWKGHWYDVWQRSQDPPRILEHVSLGTPFDPAAVPRCTTVLRLAGEARRAGGRLATVVRPQPPIVVDLARSNHPRDWAGAAETLSPNGAGTAALHVAVPRSGVYGLWLGGSFRRTLSLTVDGRAVGA